MKIVIGLAKLAVVLVVARLVIPIDWSSVHVELPRPAWIPRFGSVKPLQTVSLDEAQARVDASRGKPTVSVLYLTILPSFLKDELSDGVKRWQAGGAAVHAFSIDAVRQKDEIPHFAKALGKDVAPVWIQMPEGARCALEQLAAVTAFSGIEVNPQQAIPLVTLVLRDAGGNVLKTKAVTVPNGQAFDLQELEHAIAPFDMFVRRARR